MTWLWHRWHHAPTGQTQWIGQMALKTWMICSVGHHTIVRAWPTTIQLGIFASPMQWPFPSMIFMWTTATVELVLDFVHIGDATWSHENVPCQHHLCQCCWSMVKWVFMVSYHLRYTSCSRSPTREWVCDYQHDVWHRQQLQESFEFPAWGAIGCMCCS